MPPVIPPHVQIARVMRDEYQRFSAAGEHAHDGLIDRAGLTNLAQSREAPREVRTTAQAVLADPDLFETLDVSGPVKTPDGLIGRAALNHVLGYEWSPPAPDREPVEVKASSYNLENFFDEHDNPERIDEQATGGRIPTAADVASKVERVAHVVRGLSSDLVGLQEVENREMLDRLADAVDPVKYPPQNRVFADSGTPESRNVALLTRYPVTRVVSHSRDPLNLPPVAAPLRNWKHHLLEVELDVKGRPVVVLIAHQAARQDGQWGLQTDAFRQSEAAYTRGVAERLRAQNPDRPVVVMGDFNDEPHDPSVQTFLRDGAFVDALATVPQSARWTNIYRPSPGTAIPRALDRILVTPDLGETVHEAWVTHPPSAEDPSDHQPVSVKVQV